MSRWPQRRTAFITVELDKFDKDLDAIETNLDKLIFTMKATHEATGPIQFPQFWDEEWLQVAIQELDKRAFTPEQRMAYEMTISANAFAIKQEKRRIEEIKKNTIQKLLLQDKLTVEDIADANDVAIDYVLKIQKGLTTDK